MIRISQILKFVVCLCLSLISSIAIGQDSDHIMNETATLRGHIMDISPQQNPIDGVRVEIEGTNGEIFTVYTDKEGYYEKTGLAKGRYSISTHKKGYNSRTGKNKVVGYGGDGYVRIKMVKNEHFIAFLFRKFITWQLIAGFALGFLAALLLNSLYTRLKVR